MAAGSAIRRFAASAWLDLLFWHAAWAPIVPRALRPLVLNGAWAFAPSLRTGTLANAARILGPDSSLRDRRALARQVVGSFYDAIVEMGVNRRRSREQLLAALESVQGQDRYDAARARGQGAIIVTAHLGSFETAIAMLRQHEEHIHVVFQHDRSPVFERLRKEQHERHGIHEAPVEEGLPMWIRLRDALRQNHVVLMQADRVMPGQPGARVPFFRGHLAVPTGPVKLARLTGAPIIPAFAIALPRGRVRIVIDEPIYAADAPGPIESDPALRAIVAAIERQVRDHPEQWLCLHPAWEEDQPVAPSPLPQAVGA